MHIKISKFFMFATLLAGTALASAQQTPGAKPQDTEVWEPVPKVVTPGPHNTEPPSDAIVLFDGKNLDNWVQASDQSPAKWSVADGVLTVNKEKGVGNIETKQKFKNYQLHVEWKVPENIRGTSQASGNSGTFMRSQGT